MGPVLTRFKPFLPAILVGCALRIFFLSISIGNLGYYGGDAYRYLSLAKNLLAGSFPPYTMYPPGFPTVLAVSQGIFGTLWPVAIFNTVVWVAFTLWFCDILIRFGFSRRWGILSAWFLSLDPIWLTQTIIIGADFLGAVVFGFVLTKIFVTDWKAKNKVWLPLLCGVGFGISLFIKPVYLFAPLLVVPLFCVGLSRKKTDLKKRTAALGLLFLGVALCVGPFIATRWPVTHSLSISGHNSTLFGRYIVGNMLIGEGQGEDIYAAMDRASDIMRSRASVDPHFGWSGLIKEYVLGNPKLFLRLFALSALKTVFGHANVQFVYFFTAKEMAGAGLAVGISRQTGVWERLATLNWFWIFGMLVAFAEKCALVVWAGIGTLKKLRQGGWIEAAVLWLFLFYFATSPIVFGEARYFLPGTLALLILAGFSGAAQTNRAAETSCPLGTD